MLYVGMTWGIISDGQYFSHAYLKIACGHDRHEDWATRDRFRPGQNGHGRAYQLCKCAVQGWLGRTRYCNITDNGNDRSGTIAPGSPQYNEYIRQGGYKCPQDYISP